MARRILLHVGTPKTGTSYLQDVLFRNRERLAEAGVLYPADRFDAHFLAALDLMRLPWGGLEREAVGAWESLAAATREWDGTAIISHEILANASRAQVRRALTTLAGEGPPPEVHLVVSARDLVRQVPAEWQENVKHRAVISYADFLAEIRDPRRTGRIASWFWTVQEVPQILARWGDDLPPERVHVVTVPPAGSPSGLLWRRFEEAFGLGGLDLDLHADRSNPSLGAAETALVRRINRRVNRVLPPADYRPLVRELLAHRTLSRRTGSPRLALPPAATDWAMEQSARWVAELRSRGYDVVGDLDDLLGTPPEEPVADPDHPRPRHVARAGVDAIAVLLEDNARLRHREADLERDLHETRAALERSYLRPTYRLRRRVVLQLEGSGPGRAVLGAYRRLRGRNSRSA